MEKIWGVTPHPLHHPPHPINSVASTTCASSTNDIVPQPPDKTHGCQLENWKKTRKTTRRSTHRVPTTYCIIYLPPKSLQASAKQNNIIPPWPMCWWRRRRRWANPPQGCLTVETRIGGFQTGRWMPPEFGIGGNCRKNWFRWLRDWPGENHLVETWEE